MISHQQDGWDLRFGQTHDPFPPLSLEGWSRISVFVGIPGKYHAVHLLAGSSIYDMVQ